VKIRWLLQDAVVVVQEELILDFGGTNGVRDPGLLDSALARPKNLHAYDKKASIFRLAASYAFGIAKNHPFVDGNKRTALTIAAVFLEMNGQDFRADEAECVVIFNQLASGEVTEKELSKWFEKNSKKAF